MFAFSKLVGFFLAPGNVLVVLLAAGVAMRRTQWARLGSRFTTITAALFLFLLVFPVGQWIVRPLEDRFARPAWPRHVDGILVLGGGLDPVIFDTRHSLSEDAQEGRLVAAAELARRYPHARIVFSGGSGALFGDSTPEANAAKLAFAQLGIDNARLMFEDRSRNTWENILFTQYLVRPQAKSCWILATSASQMPRAMEIAARLHWNLLPWPTDYATSAGSFRLFSDFDLADNLRTLDIGLHEWFGIAAYRVMGRASEA